MAGGEGIANLVEKEVGGVVGEVAIRHIGIEELHGLTLGTAEGVEVHLRAENWKLSEARIVVISHLLTISSVGDKMGVAAA